MNTNKRHAQAKELISKLEQFSALGQEISEFWLNNFDFFADTLTANYTLGRDFSEITFDISEWVAETKNELNTLIVQMETDTYASEWGTCTTPEGLTYIIPSPFTATFDDGAEAHAYVFGLLQEHNIIATETIQRVEDSKRVRIKALAKQVSVEFFGRTIDNLKVFEDNIYDELEYKHVTGISEETVRDSIIATIERRI